jgi:hypothetical protein
MSDLIPFESGNVPAHIARLFGDSNEDLTANVSSGGFPVISYKGKVWHVARGGERTLVTNADGEPRSSIDVVILKGNPNISKIYYAGGYQEGSSDKPTCYSNNGIEPEADAVAQQATKCAICPHNMWGSRITESGAKGKECSDSRRLAVAPMADLENPMLLRIPAATLKDLTEYANMLNRRRAAYNAVVTRIGFDHTVAYQKLTFKPIRFLTEEEAATVVEVLDRDVIQNILGMAPTTKVVELPAPAQEAMDTAPDAAQTTPSRSAQAASKFTASAEEIDAVFEEAVSPAPAPTPPPTRAPEPELAKPPAEEKPKTAPKAQVTIVDEADASLDAILATLDDD